MWLRATHRRACPARPDGPPGERGPPAWRGLGSRAIVPWAARDRKRQAAWPPGWRQHLLLAPLEGPLGGGTGGRAHQDRARSGRRLHSRRRTDHLSQRSITDPGHEGTNHRRAGLDTNAGRERSWARGQAAGADRRQYARPGPHHAFWVILMGRGSAEQGRQAGARDRGDRPAKALDLGDHSRQRPT